MSGTHHDLLELMFDEISAIRKDLKLITKRAQEIGENLDYHAKQTSANFSSTNSSLGHLIRLVRSDQRRIIDLEEKLDNLPAPTLKVVDGEKK